MNNDGFTLPEKAIIEHNMLAISKIFDNIRFNELAHLLSLDESKAEKVS